MRILAIDTSTVAASVAVIEDGKLLGEEYTSYKLKHSEKLLPLVKHLLEDVRLDIKAIDAFAAGSGPGSFTGLRIAAATVKAFAHVSSAPIVSVSSLHAAAYYPAKLCDVCCAMIDAQRNDVYYNVYENKDGILMPLNEKDSIIDVDILLESLKKYEKVMFAGDGIFKSGKAIERVLGNRAVTAPEGLILPRASAVGLIAVRKLEEGRDIFTYENYLPNYIRPSAAEEQRRKRKML